MTFEAPKVLKAQKNVVFATYPHPNAFEHSSSQCITTDIKQNQNELCPFHFHRKN